MLLVIFGAGASFDTSPFENPSELEGMPLAKDLFMNKRFLPYMEQFDDVADIALLLHREDKTVEELLDELMLDLDCNPRRVRQMFALRYYLQTIVLQAHNSWERKLRGISNYRSLISLIEDWSIRKKLTNKAIFVTFNYDTLLDNVLQKSFGFQLEHLSNYVSGNAYKLFKVHGSVNWGRELERNFSGSGDVIKQANLQHITNNFYHLEGHTSPGYINYDFDTRPAGRRTVIPAIAVPLKSKSEFEAPKDHMDTLYSVLPIVDKVVTIGWRGIEKHFLKVLKEYLPSQAQFLTVSGNRNGSEETKANLVAAEIRDPSNIFVSSATFTSFIAHRELISFLER